LLTGPEVFCSNFKRSPIVHIATSQWQIPIQNSEQLLKRIGLSSQYFVITKEDKDTVIALKSHKDIDAFDDYEPLYIVGIKTPYKFEITGSYGLSFTIKGCAFLKDFIIQDCRFNKLVITNCLFKGSTHLESIDVNILIDTVFFKGPFSLDWAKLQNGNHMKNVVFDSSVLISCSSANGVFQFSNCHLWGSTTFSGDTLMGLIIFDSYFFSPTSFNRFVIKEFAIENSWFKSELFFWNINVTNNFYLNSTAFGTKLFLQSCILKGNTEINDNELGDTIQFNDVQLGSKFYLSKSKETGSLKQTKLMITRSPIELIIPGKNCTLTFNPHEPLEQNNELYKGLLESLKAKGYEELYKKFDLDYRHFYFTSFHHQRLWYNIQKWWWNFGYDKYRVIGNTLLVLLLFSFIVYGTGVRKYLENEYRMETLSAKYQQNMNIRNRALQELSNYFVAVIFTANLFFRFGLKLEDMKFSNYYRSFFIIIIYLAGLICTLFIFNFIITSK
jgi:hypothetical protein